MKGKMKPEQRKRVSEGLKKYYKNHDVWNKGKRKPKEYYDNLQKERRSDPNYYKKELYNNAVRSKKNKYYNEKRLAELTEYTNKVKEKAGYYGQQEWSEDEIKYLIDNYKETTTIEMALHLKRSYSSVVHKLNRLHLKKYNKYNI
jgi:hypothetical protein